VVAVVVTLAIVAFWVVTAGGNRTPVPDEPTIQAPQGPQSASYPPGGVKLSALVKAAAPGAYVGVVTVTGKGAPVVVGAGKPGAHAETPVTVAQQDNILDGRIGSNLRFWGGEWNSPENGRVLTPYQFHLEVGKRYFVHLDTAGKVITRAMPVVGDQVMVGGLGPVAEDDVDGGDKTKVSISALKSKAKAA
jgi:hypothetical protein